MSEPLPLEIFSQHVAVIGRTGSGKSFTARGIVERLLRDGRRVCVLDVTGVWWGLKSDRAGTGPGFPVVVIGGDHADVPLTEAAAPAVARLVGQARHSFIIDLSGLSISAMHRFTTAFCEELYRVNRVPLHLVMEEVDEVAPQTGMPGAEQMIGAVCRLYQRGRVKGLRLLAITQRPANLHKRVLAQCSALILMRLTAPQDRKAAFDWISGHADVAVGRKLVDGLPKLPIGTGIAWVPELDLLENIRFPAIATFDSMRAPADGETAMEPVNLADVDLAEIRAALSATEPPAAATAHRPAALQAEYARGRADGVAAGRGEIARQRMAWAAEIARVHDAVGKLHAAVLAGDEPPAPAPPASAAAESQVNPPSPGRAPPPRRRTSPAAASPAVQACEAGELQPVGRAILMVLAQRHPARWTWQQAATLAGKKAVGPQFAHGRKELRDRGLVHESDDLVTASAAGLALIGQPAAADRSTGDLVETWCGKLDALAPVMLRSLARRGAQWITATDLAREIGRQPFGPQWSHGLSQIRRNGLLDESAAGIRLSGILRAVP